MPVARRTRSQAFVAWVARRSAGSATSVVTGGGAARTGSATTTMESSCCTRVGSGACAASCRTDPVHNANMMNAAAGRPTPDWCR